MKSLQFFKENQKSIKTLLSTFYDGFYPLCNDGTLLFENFNKTIRKKPSCNTNSAIRVHCEVAHRILDKISFSIICENLDSQSRTLIGFCVKNGSSSLKNGSSSFMLNAENGNFVLNAEIGENFGRSCHDSTYLPINVKNNIMVVYTSILDIKEKTIAFLLNGRTMGAPKKIDLKEEEIDFLRPCVDISQTSVKVTLIEDSEVMSIVKDLEKKNLNY